MIADRWSGNQKLRMRPRDSCIARDSGDNPLRSPDTNPAHRWRVRSPLLGVNLRKCVAVYVQGSGSGNRTDLALLCFLLELGFCFMTVASVPPVNDQSSAATLMVEKSLNKS